MAEGALVKNTMIGGVEDALLDLDVASWQGHQHCHVTMRTNVPLTSTIHSAVRNTNNLE